MENKIIEDNELFIKERKNVKTFEDQETELLKPSPLEENTETLMHEEVSANENQTEDNEIAEKPQESQEPIQEPIVKADGSQEDESPSIQVEEITVKANETAEKPTEKKARKPKAAKPKRKKEQDEQKENSTIKSFGILSDELKLIDDNKKTREEELYENFKKLNTAQKSKQLLWGEVYAVEPTNILSKLIIAVNWNGVKVIIPDIEYFEPNFEFGVRYQESDEDTQRKRREILATYQNGARICFIVKACNLIDVEVNGEKRKNIICIASRKEAMSMLRDIYFFHKTRKHEINEKDIVKPDKIAQAHVIAVKEDHILVECLGVETRISSRDATDGYLESCKDLFQPGDTLPVKIKKIYINGKDEVYLSVTGKLNDVSEAISTMQVRASYLGVVEGINLEKRIYNVRLKNNVLAGVLFENVPGNISLTIGTKVSVKVTKILDTFVYGSAVKL